MNDKDMPKKQTVQKAGAQFDMYHFFSRKDVILAAVVILALLVYFVLNYFSRVPTA